MLIYASCITPRLQYMAGFAGELLFGKAMSVTDDAAHFLSSAQARINYSSGRLHEKEYHIIPQGLLAESSISAHTIIVSKTDGLASFFPTGGDHAFDILAASFYLLSRYEEYLPHEKDMYGRYDHIQSLAYREGFLQQPLINQWFVQWRKALQQKFPELVFAKKQFQFVPSYDIDIAWSYRHKGLWRSTGALLRSLLMGQWRDVRSRIAVYRNKRRDPFDTYGVLNSWHEQYRLRPYYFFPMAEKNGRYDKNILPGNKALQVLVLDHARRYPLGLHPSWRSGDEPSFVTKEKKCLEEISGTIVTASRQHYIRFTLPFTFRQLIEAGIRFDFSMGYGSINGFRASVCTPYYWYDLEKERATDLLLFPFCFMDANSFHEQRYTPAQALVEMKYYYKAVKDTDGLLITIWHNHFLGTDLLYTGWREVYASFLKQMSEISPNTAH